MELLPKAVLYSYWASSCAWRVRIALNLKEVPYEIVSVDLLKKGGGEQNEPKFKDEVNVMGRVPVLDIDGHRLVESLNIIHYLEESRPRRYRLTPDDLYERSKVRTICEIIATGIQPLQNLSVIEKIEKEEQKSFVQHFITLGFTAIEKILANSAGKYCCGDIITMADCCLVPQVFSAQIRFGMDLQQFPIIRGIDEELKSHPAFIKAHPSNQPDCP